MEKIRAADAVSDEDWRIIENHLQAMQIYRLERESGSIRVTITIEPLSERESKAWHGLAMVIRAVTQYGGRSDRQYFSSVETAKTGLEGWRYGVEKIPQAPTEAADNRKEIVPDNIGTVWPDTFGDSTLRERETSAKSGSIGRAGGLLRCISRLFIGPN